MDRKDAASYAAAGVSLEKADSFLEAMLRWVRRTEEIPGAGLRPLIPNGYYASVLDCGLDVALAFTTDGVGSKILVAEMANDYTGIGIDCIAMNVNDLVCVGAKPLAMVDYLAIQDPPVDVGDQIGKGLYEGALQAGISIPGGELAQLPEMISGLREGEGVDLAGAAIGLVERSRVSNGQGIEVGDVLIGMLSNGVHSNGFTLARNVLFDRGGLRIDERVPELGTTVGAELLRPTAIYVKAFDVLREAGLHPRAAMHITGGGFLNLLRASSRGLRFVVDQLPPAPPIFALIDRLGEVGDEEMYRVFNMGIGMVLVVSPDQVDATLAALAGAPTPQSMIVGRVEAGEGLSVELPTVGLRSQGDRLVRD